MFRQNCIIFYTFSTFAIFFLFTGIPSANELMNYPAKSWQRYPAPEEAGWSLSQLEKIREFSKKIGMSAIAVIYDGKIIMSWGDVNKKLVVGSVRKSFLNALYGIHVKEGKIDLNKTMADLGIDDSFYLWKSEKKARVVDLLKSRSGIYHDASSESQSMKAKRPPRGSHEVGTFFYYNNWDFNALGTIFEQETGTKIFEEFYRRIAVPLQMEHFQVEDGFYHFEKQRSIHPAYHFKMSVLDMARFGLLYIRKGAWKGQQIIPKEWIEKSTISYSTANPGIGYGYLWWIWTEKPFQSLGMYSALGSGGRHIIDILPKVELVLVRRSEKSVHYRCRNQLLNMILKAHPDSILDSISNEPQQLTNQYKKLNAKELHAELTGNTFYGPGSYNYLAPDGKIYGKLNNQSDVGHWFISEENGGEFCRKWNKWGNNLRCYPWSQFGDLFELNFTWQCHKLVLKRVKGNSEALSLSSK